MVVVLSLGSAGQALGRVMRPLFAYLSLRGIRNMMYVDDGRTSAATKKRADNDYAVTINVFQQAGFTVAVEKSDKL